MRSKLIILVSLVAIGIVAAFVLMPRNSPPTQNPPPPEAFFNQTLRNELAGIPTSTATTIDKKVAGVANEKSPAASLPQWNCGGANTNWECYEKYYTALTANGGITAAFDDLRARYAKDAYTQSQCHPLTHVIGRIASQKFATPGEAFTKGDPFCWSGYYHGVMEGIVGRIGLKNLPAKIDSICASIKEKEGIDFNYYNCVHGLGHGVMSITQDELFQSIDTCDKLTGWWEEVSCASGAFMENIIVDGKNHKTKYLNPDDPLYPCNATPEKYRDTCYLMQTSYMVKINGRNFKQTFAWCKEVEPAHRDTCYASLGRDASGGSVSDVKQTHDICMLGEDKEQQNWCVTGAVKDFISYLHSDTRAKELCNSFDDADIRSNCLSTAESYYKQF